RASTASRRSTGMPRISRDLSCTPSNSTPPRLLAKAASPSARSFCSGPLILPPAKRTSFSSRKLSSPRRIFSRSSPRLASMSDLLAQTLPAASKCLAAAFHHLADFLPHRLLLQCATLADTALAAGERHHVHQLRIPIDHHIRVVGNDDELAPQLVLANLAHDQVVDQVIVQVVLGLIEDDRFFAKGQQKSEQRCRALALGSLADAVPTLVPLVFDTPIILPKPGEQVIGEFRFLQFFLQIVAEMPAQGAGS